MSGPYCTSMLADLGAEVIKIEIPGLGDEARHFGPYQEDESTYFMMLNRSKKSVTVNMKEPRGQDIIKDLIPLCDVIVENFRPGVMDRLGLGEGQVRALNPDIVYASISGFGQDSPLRNWPAFDLVIQAMSGLMSLTGPKGGPATAVGESMADVCTGMFAAFGIVSALFDRERGGSAGNLDVAMLDSVLAMQLTGLSRQLYAGETPKPAGNRHPVTYPVDSFSARDGDIVMVCFSQQAFCALCELMGRADLAEDPRFRTNEDRNKNEDELRAVIAAWAASQGRDELVNTLQSAGIPAGPVWSLGDVTSSAHVVQRGLVTSGQHPKFGDVPLVPQPVKFNGVAQTGGGFVPTLGEHTEEVLRDLLGLDEAETEILQQAGII
jgi:CoA:oxalate CoA-transferase